MTEAKLQLYYVDLVECFELRNLIVSLILYKNQRAYLAIPVSDIIKG